MRDTTDEPGHGDFVFICPSNLECVLGVGGADDLPALREWCEALPAKSYGSVFVEVESPVQIEPFAVPPGVSVTWLPRSSASQPRGAAAMRAVDGWLDEWMRGDPMSGRYVHLWAGLSQSASVSAQWGRIEAELAETWAAAAEFRGHHA